MAERRPKVTVLMAVHNGEDYLQDAIQSILSQTFRDFEFLIVDDGSTDRSREIVQSFRDGRIRLVETGRNIGLPAALNAGLREARGEYIARQDADDRSLPGRLEAQVALLDASPDIHAVGAWFQSIDGQGALFGCNRPAGASPEIAEQLAAGLNPLAHGSVAFRRETVLDLGGYDERFWYAQDFDLWLRLVQNGRNLAVVPQDLYQRRKLPSGSAFKTLCQKRYGALALEQFRAGRRIEFEDVRQWVGSRYPESLRADPGVRGRYWILLAMTALNNQKRSLARSYGLRAFRTPRTAIRLKAVCLLALSFLPTGSAVTRHILRGRTDFRPAPVRS